MRRLSEWLERATENEELDSERLIKSYMLGVISSELEKAGYKDTEDTQKVLKELLSLK